MRDVLALLLLLAGSTVILVAGPAHGINGMTLLGVLLGAAGLVVHLTGPPHS